MATTIASASIGAMCQRIFQDMKHQGLGALKNND